MDWREFAFRRKNRCVGLLLDKIERMPFWAQLSSSEQEELRKQIKTKISSYHKDVLDLIEGLDVSVHMNALAIREKDKQRHK